MKKKKKFAPGSAEEGAEIVAFLRSMTPEELWEFIHYRTPGIEMTDMTGMFGDVPNRMDEPEVFERAVELLMQYRHLTREQAEAKARSWIVPRPAEEPNLSPEPRERRYF